MCALRLLSSSGLLCCLGRSIVSRPDSTLLLLTTTGVRPLHAISLLRALQFLQPYFCKLVCMLSSLAAAWLPAAMLRAMMTMIDLKNNDPKMMVYGSHCTCRSAWTHPY